MKHKIIKLSIILLVIPLINSNLMLKEILQIEKRFEEGAPQVTNIDNHASALNDSSMLRYEKQDDQPTANIYFNGNRYNRTTPIMPPLTIASKILSKKGTRFIALEIAINSLFDANVELEYSYPPFVTLRENGHPRQFRITKNEPQKIVINLLTQRDFDYIFRVNATATTLTQSIVFTTTHSVSICVDENSASSKGTLPEKQTLHSAFGDEIRQWQSCSKTSFQWNEEGKNLLAYDATEMGSLTNATFRVEGVFQYEDRELTHQGFTGNITLKPIRYADVEVFDNDTGEILATSGTNEDGYFSIEVSDTLIRNVSIRAVTSSHNDPRLFNQTVRELPEIGGALYAVCTPVYENHSPEQDINFTASPVIASHINVGGAFHIFDLAEYAERYVEALTTELPSLSLTVYWSKGTGYGKFYDVNGHVYLAGASGDDDSYDDTVILHEIGHYIALTYSCDAEYYGGHGLDGIYDIRLTYTEGLGSYFMGVIRNYIGVPQPLIYIETDGENLLWYGFSMPDDTDTPSSYSSNNLTARTAANEVTVAHSLFDLVDGNTTNDGTVGFDDDPLNLPNLEGDKLVWNVLTAIKNRAANLTKEITMETFFDTWMEINPEYTTQFVQILVANGIEYIEDGFEQDDDPSEATSLSANGESHHHTFFGANDSDWHVFIGEVGIEYVIKTEELLDGADTVLELYDSDGSTKISENNNRDETTRSSLIRFVPKNTSQYYIRAYRYLESPKPVGEYGKYDLIVYILNNPEIESVTPSSGPVQGGTSVIINGSNFEDGLSVYFGVYASLNVTVVDENMITLKTPANVPGSVDIIVKNPVNEDGLMPTGSLSNGFVYTGEPLPPVITAIMPNFGPSTRASNVTIIGEYIVANATVKWNELQCKNFTVVDPKTIQATLEPLPQNLYDVTVTNSEGKSATLKHAYESVLEVRNETAIFFDESNNVTSTIWVDEDYIISDLYVYVNISHDPSPMEMNLTLESPSGKRVIVFDQLQVAEGGQWRRKVSSYFGYDEAPSEMLTQFRGEHTRGLWKLHISSRWTSYVEDPEILHSWRLYFFRYRYRDIARIVYSTSEYRNYLMAFNERTGEELYRARLEGAYPWSVAVSADGRYVYAGTYCYYNATTEAWSDSAIGCFETLTGRKIKTFILEGNMGLGGLAVAPNSTKLIVVTSGHLYVIDTSTNMITGTLSLPEFQDVAPNVVVSPNGRKAYIPNYEDRYVQVVDLDNLVLLSRISTSENTPIDVDISLDATKGVIVFSDPVLYVFNPENDTITKNITLPSWGSRVKLTPDGNKAFFAIWQWYAGFGMINLLTEEGKIFEDPEATTCDITVSHDYKVYVSDWGVGRLLAYDAKTETKLNEMDTLDGVGPAGIDYVDSISKVSNLTATGEEEKVILTWNKPTNGGTPIVAYKIYRGNASGLETWYTTINSSSTIYVDTDVAVGITYYYRVSAVTTAGEGPLSDETMATPDSSPTEPIILVLSPENKTYSTTFVTLNFSIIEATSWIGYSLDYGVNVSITGNITLILDEGFHNIIVYANDTVGNMGSSDRVYFTVDVTPPEITVSQYPSRENVVPEDKVRINATVTDHISEVKQVTLNYTNGNGTWIAVNMTNLEGNVWNATIPAFPYGTNVTYVVIAEDKANNTITTEEMGYEYQYHVIPEFSSFLIPTLFMTATLLAVSAHRKKARTRRIA